MFIQWVLPILVVLYSSSTVRAAGRIVGGDIVGSNSTYPYFALVKTRRENAEGAVSFGQCGGTLISPTSVLTAAHCVINPSIVSISVEVGAITTSDQYSVKMDVISGVINPSYKENTGVGDLAVLRLLSPVDIEPANVTFFGNLAFPDVFDNVTVIGFGFNATDSGVSDVLREITVDVRAPDDCGVFDLSMGRRTNTQFCAGGQGMNPCLGDSGGPALFGENIVAGITSFGSGCDEGPAIFTRVSNYEEFVREAVCTGSGQASWCEGEELLPTMPGDSPAFCFHGSNLVEVQDERDVVRMEDLELGDMVHVGDGVYEPIYTFGHRAPNTEANFLQITTQHSKLRLTPDHMLITPSRGAVPASMLQVGEHLLGASGVKDRIQSIKTVKDRGLYAPFTPSGQIVVNSILASSYAALEESEGLELFGVTFSHQWLYHAVLLPHRIACYHLGRCDSEQYSADGISLWMDQPLKLAEWLLSQSTSLRFVWLLPLCLIATLLTAADALVVHPTLLVALLLATTSIPSRHRLKLKQA